MRGPRRRSPSLGESSGCAPPTSATAARTGTSPSSFPARPSEIDAALIERFEAEHDRLYGTRLEAGSPVVIRALRLDDLSAASRWARRARPAQPSRQSNGRRASADFGETHGRLEAPVVPRAAIGAEPRRGPLLVDEYDTTVVVPPDWTVARGQSDALVLEHVPVGGGVVAQHPVTEPDAILRPIVANALATVADEMATTIFRTAHSAVVRDAMDYSAALCGPAGETIAQAVTIPLQLGSIPNAMKTLFERFGGTFAPGDIYIVNDPFDGASHTPDIFVVKPAFAEDRLIGFGVSSPTTPTSAVASRGRSRATAPRSSRRASASPGSSSTTAARRWRPSSGSSAPTSAFPTRRRRPQRPGRRVHDRRAGPAGARRTLRLRAARPRHGRAARPHRGVAASADRELARRDGDLHRLHGLRWDRRGRRADHRASHHRGRRADRRLLRLGADGARCAQLHAVVRRGERLPDRDGGLRDRHPADGRGA